MNYDDAFLEEPVTHLLLSLMLSSQPALADKAPRCGASETYDWDTGECDTGDCEDNDGDQARRVESSGIPMPVKGSLLASVLIIGISARRRFRG
jgi:hypothetical protein